MYVISVAAFRRVAVVASMAVALAGLLPAPHAHLGRPDRIVHVHAIADFGVSHQGEDSDHDHLTFEHDDHGTAQTLVLAYDFAARFILTAVTAAAAMSSDVPEAAGIRHPTRTTLLPTHDPPLRFTSSPAPPAVV